MARVEDDPMLAAAGELYDALKWKRAEERGEVSNMDAGVYTVDDAGELSYLGTQGAVNDALAEEFALAQADANELALRREMEDLTTYDG